MRTFLIGRDVIAPHRNNVPSLCFVMDYDLRVIVMKKEIAVQLFVPKNKKMVRPSSSAECSLIAPKGGGEALPLDGEFVSQSVCYI